jgi:ankyrin repeat protein
MTCASGKFRDTRKFTKRSSRAARLRLVFPALATMMAVSGCAQVADYERARRDRAEAVESVAAELPRATEPAAQPGEAETTLIWAAGIADLPTALRMLGANASVNARGADGDSALGAATRARSREIARRLLARGADPNRRDRFGSAPLSSAVRLGELELADMLLAAGADVDIRDVEGVAPLTRAVQKDRPDLVARLLRARPDLYLADREGATALHRAAMLGLTEIARLLLQAGAPRAALDHEGKPPLFWALVEGHEDTALLLLERGADPRQQVNGHDMAYYAGWAQAKRASAAIDQRIGN